jgi:uncharacterized protein YjbI with pentapeptide repeats
MSRLQYVIKTYEKQPVVVRDTLRVAFNMLAIHGVNFHDIVFAKTDAYTRYFALNTSPLNELLAQHAQRLAQYFKYDSLFPWVARELARSRKQEAAALQQPVYYDVQLQDLIMRGTSIAQWAEANRVDLTKVDLDTALQESRDWEAPVAVVPGYTVYEEFGDGWTVQQLVSYEELASEGEAMQHCVGEYGERVDCGRVIIYSLRDPRGKPHVTMEFDPQLQRFKQIYGKQNEPPKEVYAARVRQFIEARFDGEPAGMIMAGADPKTLNLRGANLRGVDMGGIDFSGADLTGADFSQCYAGGVKMLRADLRDAKLQYANLTRADLTHADLARADLSESNLYRTDLRGANLSSANLAKAHLSSADLQNTILQDANLRRADLTYAVLEGAYFEGANLAGADLTGAHLEGVDFSGAYWNDETTWPAGYVVLGEKRRPREIY